MGATKHWEKNPPSSQDLCKTLQTARDREAPALAQGPLGPSKSGFEGPFTSLKIETWKKKKKEKDNCEQSN